MPSLVKIGFKPNWIPSLNPAWYDISDRLLAGSMPQIRLGVQRREDPTILTHGEVSFAFTDFDNVFSDLFDLDKIQGTDLANLRAPLIHMGEVQVLEQVRPDFPWRVLFYGLVSQRSVRLNSTDGTAQFTAFSPGKNLEAGSAERVHRFSSIVGPAPYVLFGFSIEHPVAPPGETLATGNAYINNGSDVLDGNLTLYAVELRIGNTIGIGGTYATITEISNNGLAKISSPWGGPTIPFPGQPLLYSGQNDAYFRLIGAGASALKFFPGDTFKVIAPVDPLLLQPGAATVSLAENEALEILSTTPSGDDLLIRVTELVPDLPLFAGQAMMQILTPWYHGLRYSVLLQLLLDEVNAALLAAGYPAGMQLVQDSIDALLPTPFVDLIDQNELVFPSTGITWAVDGGARALLQASGAAGQKKPDILLDPALAERAMATCTADTTFSFTAGVGACAGVPGGSFPSIDTGNPNVYANPALQLAGQSPPPDRTLIPQVGQDLFQYGVTGAGTSRISERWQMTPSAYSRALPTTLASAYRLESIDCAYHKGVSSPPDCLPTDRNTVGYVLGLYTTVDNGVTWALSSQSVQRDEIFVAGEELIIPIETFSQGGLQVFQLGPASFLYLLTDGGRLKAHWALQATDTATPAALVALFNAAAGQMQDGAVRATNAGNRSGAVFTGADVIYFEDRPRHTSVGMRTGAGITIPTSPSVAVTGVGTRFLRDFAPGDVIFVPSIASPNPNRFTVLSVTSDTALTLLSANTGPAYGGSYQIEKQPASVRLWWWDGAQMRVGSMVGFPALNGADFANAMVDQGRQHLCVVMGSLIYRFAFTFAAGVLTATATDAFPLDTINYNTLIPPSSHAAAAAWLTGPVDALQGDPSQQVDFNAANDALLVGTTEADYILSDAYGGIIKIADFEGMSCAEAYSGLLQLAQMFIVSGADQTSLPSPGGYIPIPTVFVLHRDRTGNIAFDLTTFPVTADSEPWIIQYASIQVNNSKYNIPAGAADQDAPQVVVNDQQFTFAGQLYKVLAARFGGGNVLPIDNRFIFTVSAAKLIANNFAFEFLIPRPSARIKVKDPYFVFGGATLSPLQLVKYLARTLTPYAPAVVLTGRVLTVTQNLADDVIDLEIA